MISRNALFIALAAFALTAGSAQAAAPDAGPSFDCARATSHVNQTICASPALSALDRKLAGDYAAILHQGGIDAAALQADERRWLSHVRDACADAACLGDAYRARDAALLDRSRRAASPAAYAETQDFPAPPRVLAAARALIGKSCAGAPARPLPGFSKIEGWLPIVEKGAYIGAMQKDGTRLAFLLAYPGDQFDKCRVADVVVLPPPHRGEAFMQCSLRNAGSTGFGMRWRPPATTVYWSVDADAKRIIREPLGVLGEAPICQQPESGD